MVGSDAEFVRRVVSTAAGLCTGAAARSVRMLLPLSPDGAAVLQRRVDAARAGCASVAVERRSDGLLGTDTPVHPAGDETKGCMIISLAVTRLAGRYCQTNTVSVHIT